MIHSYGAAKDVVWRHFPYYKAAKADIVGVNREDTPHEWPDNVPTIAIGIDQYVQPDLSNLPTRLVESVRAFLKDERFAGYSDCCIAEYDTVFLRALGTHPRGFVASYVGLCSPQWKVKSPWFIHPPWWFDRPSAQRFHRFANPLLKNGQYEGGTPDVFAGLAASHAGLTPKTIPNAISVNGRDMHVRLDEVVEAVRRGARIIHGIRTQDQLMAVLDAAK